MSLLPRKLTYLQSLLLLVVYILPQEAGSQASRPREGCFNSTPDLGMARGTIPDSDITASSMINSDSDPHFARLGNSKAWIADKKDLNPWIQVNFQKAINVTAIATQGFSGSYIRQYYLSYSVSGNQWMNYTTQGVTKVFQANQNDTMLATVVLNPLVVAQYIRLHPTNCSKSCALQMELYGCNSTAGFPGRPPAPTVSSISATSISIQWNAPDEVGDGITGYHVRWQEEGASILKQKVVTSGRVTILDKLTPYTWYTIQVQAYNNKGVGIWSEELRVRSNESVPSVAPGNFKLDSSSSLSLDVSWDAIPANQQQGKLLGYRIVYKKNGYEVNHTKSVGPNQYSHKIEKLEYASYAVKVAGYTGVGVGKFTEPKSRFPNEGGKIFVNNCTSYTVHKPPPRARGFNWRESKELCQNENEMSVLVSIETVEELNFLKKQLTQNNLLRHEYFIGLERLHGKWKWISGNGEVDVSYKHKLSDGERGRCAKMYFYRSGDVMYDDINCVGERNRGYICERPVECQLKKGIFDCPFL